MESVTLERPSKTKDKWGRKLAKARQLRSEGAGLVYDRVKLLCEVYSDAEFIEHCRGLDQNPEDILDDEVGDLCANFLTLRAVLDHFPDRESWEGERLDVMVAKIREKEQEERAARRPQDTPRMSWKERAQGLEKENDRLKGELARLQTSFDALLAKVG